MHEFKASLQAGYEGELFMRHWLSKQYPGLRWEEVDLRTDLSGIDLYVTAKESIQVKWDNRAQETGNVFIETISQVEHNRPGWANKCAADVLYYLCPGLGYLFRIERPVEVLSGLLPAWEGRWGTKDVRNSSWTTRGICVPIQVFSQHFPPEFDEQLKRAQTRGAA